MPEANSGAKWVLGILGTVTAALLVWWLTHPGGPLNPLPPPPEKPRPLSIVDVKIVNARAPGSATASVTVYNNATTAGEDCRVSWYSGSEVAAQLASHLLPQKSSQSETFGLRPAETRQVNITSVPYNAPGSFDSLFEVHCLGVNNISEQLARRVEVLPAQ